VHSLLPENKAGSQERKILMTRTSVQKGYLFEENGIWYLRYWERDHYSAKWKHPKKRLGSFKNEKSARLVADKIMAEVNERNNTPPHKLYSDMTFQQFVDTQWRSYEATQAHAPSTVRARQAILDNHLLPYFGKKKLCAIEPLEISIFIDGLQALAGNTQNNIYTALHLIFELAAQFEIIERNPVKPKRHRPKVQHREKPTLTAEQISRLIEAMPTAQERLLVLLISYTALRANEALALRWQDFDATAATLFVRHTLYKGKVKPTKTKSSMAKINIPPTLAGHLQDHREGSRFYGEDDFIFSRDDGRPANYYNILQHLKATLRQIGVTTAKSSHGFHILRHSAATIAFEKKGNLRLVQTGLRHANSQITSDVYIHPSDEFAGEFGKLLEVEIKANRTLSGLKGQRKTG
jgi:integrase